MAFGPILGGGSGGGGGGDAGIQPVYLTATTGSIDESTSADLDVALPEGITRCVVMWARLTRTAGTSIAVSAALHPDDARSGTPEEFVFGSEFTGADIGADPIYGPAATGAGSTDRATPSYTNIDGSEFLRLVVRNTDFNESAPGTFRLDLIIYPLPTLDGES